MQFKSFSSALFQFTTLNQSQMSAALMSLFIIVPGVTSGTYAATILIEKNRYISIVIPSVIALLITLAMYFGEMFLLSGHLYRFGQGMMFGGIPHIVLAPVDIIILLLSGFVTAFICRMLNKKTIHNNAIAK